jgi:hypothetical protein
MSRIRRSPLAAAALAAALFAACGEATGPETFPEQFEVFWGAFDRQYPYFAYKDYDWDSVRTALGPQVAQVQSQAQLIALFKQAVQPLRDLHITFTTPGGLIQATYVPTAAINWSQGAWLAIVNANGWVQKDNWGHARIGGVPYIAIGGWNTTQFKVAEFDAALESFRDDSVLIIDVRMNGGGNDSLATQVAGRFTGVAVLAEYTQGRSGPAPGLTAPQPHWLTPRGPWTFQGRVALLVGRGCFSSNESFVAMMRELPNVTVMGDTTGGASGNPGSVTLGGGWSVMVPRTIIQTAQHAIIEWQGIPPDTVVPWRADLALVGRDTVIEFARSRVLCPACAAGP